MVGVLHHRPKGLVGEHLDGMRLEVRPEFSRRGDDGESHILQGWVSRLWFCHVLADVENMFLFAPILSYEYATAAEEVTAMYRDKAD